MSVLRRLNNSLLLDHADLFDELYNDVTLPEPYVLSKKLFSVQNTKNNVIRKRAHDSNCSEEETRKVQQMFEAFKCEIPTDLKMKIKSKYFLLSTSDVRDWSTKLFASTIFDHSGISGGNDSEMSLKCKIKEEYFLIPPNSRFFCGNVHEQCKKLTGTKFDVVIADPPWWNKYIRRLKSANDKLSYKMMYNDEIASIPLKDVFSDNCLIAVWCTNAPSNIDAVKNTIFPQWGVTYITTWYWLKVTIDLEPLCPFGVGSQKQPYERIILGGIGDVVVPDSQLLVSVPSALHSHKPPLLDVLKPYVKAEKPKILELFARYLLPNTTSVGYEPLKWQHISLFETVT